MNAHTDFNETISQKMEKPAKEWIRVLAKYRDPSMSRSLFEIGVTSGPLLAIWGLSIAALSIHWSLSLALSILSGLFLVRLFIIQHDCGHASFFANRKVQDWAGRIIGVFTCTPYAVWKQSHALHHSHAGDLDERGIGDVYTMTVDEYRAASTWKKISYRIYRHPLFLLVLAPTLLFVVKQRVPGKNLNQKKFWISAMGTNVAIAALVTAFALIGGWQAVFLTWLPSVVTAASIGVWLFYVQHQFEETMWDHHEDWDMHEAAFHGSSHYVMPQPLQWLTGNIGIHHVHHLFSRIPFYRLPEVLKNHPELNEAQRLTIRESIDCARRHLWDENSRKLLTFKEARFA